jgi:hypothetical protein
VPPYATSFVPEKLAGPKNCGPVSLFTIFLVPKIPEKKIFRAFLPSSCPSSLQPPNKVCWLENRLVSYDGFASRQQ